MVVPGKSPRQRKLSIDERTARLLGLIPWVAKSGGATLEEVSQRFDYPRSQLDKDLRGVVQMVGVYPFTPDVLIEVDIRDGYVNIDFADWFKEPSRLSPDEVTRLLAAGRACLKLMADLEGDASEAGVGQGALLRALAKLTQVLSSRGEVSVDLMDVSLGEAPSDTLRAVNDAYIRRLRVEMEYYSAGRDVLQRRGVDPQRLFPQYGYWYLRGYCHTKQGERSFRIDRIRSIEVTDEPITVVLPDEEDDGVRLRSPVDEVTLELAPDALWATEFYPTSKPKKLANGRFEVTMQVAEQPWLERRLLQLGKSASIVRVSGNIPLDLRSQAARRVLERYRK